MPLPTTLTLEERREFFKDYREMCAVFGQERVDAGLMLYKVTDLVEEKQVPLQDANHRSTNYREPYGPHRYIFRANRCYRFVRQDGWEKTEFVTVDLYMVPYVHQGNYHSKLIIRPALLAMAPWLATYEFDAYTYNFGRAYEFYVRFGADINGHRSLYVPIDAFKNGDSAAIIERNATYLKRYTRSDDTWKKMCQLDVVKSFLADVAHNNGAVK